MKHKVYGHLSGGLVPCKSAFIGGGRILPNRNHNPPLNHIRRRSPVSTRGRRVVKVPQKPKPDKTGRKGVGDENRTLCINNLQQPKTDARPVFLPLRPAVRA